MNINSKTIKSFRDWRSGVTGYRLWTYLAVQEIKQRYRRSVLGPLWITLSMSVMIFAMGPIYGKIFKHEIENYFLYLATGYIVWSLILNTVNDLTDSYLSSERFIKQIKLPYISYVLKTIWKNLIIFAHNIIVIIIVMILFPPIGYNYYWLLPASLFLLFVNFVWIGVFLSIFCTRFRDLNQLVANMMQLAFFLTPILWKIELLGEYGKLEQLNIFYHMVNATRGIFINDSSCLYSIKILCITGIIGLISSFIFFTKYRSKISYWI